MSSAEFEIPMDLPVKTAKSSGCTCTATPKKSASGLPPRLSKAITLVFVTLLMTVISMAAYKQMVLRKNVSGKSLEFQRIHKGIDDDGHDHRLKKSDPFIDDFVPREYTDYLTIKPKEFYEKARRTRAVDSSDYYNEIDSSKSADPVPPEQPQQQHQQQRDVSTTTTTTQAPNDEENVISNENIESVQNDDLPDNIGGAGETSTPDTNIDKTETEMEKSNLLVPSHADSTELTSPSSTSTTTTTTTTSSPALVSPRKSNELEPSITLKMLSEQVKALQKKLGLDHKMPIDLTTPEAHQKILILISNLITKLEEKERESAVPTTTTTTPAPTGKAVAAGNNILSENQQLQLAPGANGEVGNSTRQLLICSDLQQFKIHPNDSPHIVRKKQGYLMRCYMDENADPCERFYDYACGKWANFHPIPKDKGGYDIFEILREDMEAKLIQMLEAPIDELDGNSTSAAKALYASCMNTEIIESRKETPLLKLLKDFGGWPVVDGDSWVEDTFDWQKTITKLREFNNDILVAIWVGPDGKDSDDYIVQFDQSDLLLPSAEYYVLGLGHPIMQTYYNLLVNVATLLGADRTRARKEMKELIEFEIELASIMIPPQERRNYSEIYLKLDLAKLSAEVPDFDFNGYLSNLIHRPLNSSEEVVIYALPYFKKLTKLMKASSKRVTANYILWRFVRHRINNLDTRFLKVQQELFRRLYGREETPARQKFCVAYVNGNLGNSVGALFVRKYFDEHSKVDMESLTDQVMVTFRDLVMSSGWLSNDTKKLADSKIKAIVHNIGYPDYILDDKLLQDEFFGLTYKKDEFFENVLKNLRGRTLKEMRQLDDRVNRTLWTTTPAVVNAYYSRNRNQIMFPAGILQPPFYHKHFPKSLNFGGIGVVIGHEITHGFDDKGRQFDAIGNINQWWDHISSEKFQEKAQCIIDQYNGFNVEEVGIYLNGLNTQGENIADNGGIKQSFYAYQNWVTEKGLASEGPLPGLEHLTDEQLFFLNFAQVWCGSTRPEALRSKIKTAVHAPGKYRVFGTLSNSEEFAKAFNCPKGSRMNPDYKCSVW